MTIELAIEKTKELLGESVAQVYAARFRRVQQELGAERTFERISFATNNEELMDYLVEVNFALVFAGLKFQIEIEPFGKEGPDFRITGNGYQLIVEVTRFREIHFGPPEIDLSEESSILQEYGNAKRDVRKAVRKIYRKFSQVGDKESIIAIWNDDKDLEEIEVKTAVKSLQNDASRPKKLLFVLYGSGLKAPAWVGPKGHQQFYCFPFHPLLHSHHRHLQTEFESSWLQETIQLALQKKAG